MQFGGMCVASNIPSLRICNHHIEVRAPFSRDRFRRPRGNKYQEVRRHILFAVVEYLNNWCLP